MSLLDEGREVVTVYHAQLFYSEDGNPTYRASQTDVDVIPNSTVQIAAQSGTSARRSEQENEGYFTEDIYRFHPPRGYTRAIHSQSQVEWRGLRYSIIGNPQYYNGSANTQRYEYTIRRS